VPATEPPYRDGETPEPPGQRELPLVHLLDTGLPAVPVAPVRPVQVERLVGGSVPDPTGQAARLAQGVLEVLAGDRPLAQLLPWTTRAVHSDLARYLAALREHARPDRSRVAIHRIRISRPADDVAEVCVIVRTPIRWHALALRLEYRDARWLCSELES
jgi:hypothetical protein